MKTCKAKTVDTYVVMYRHAYDNLKTVYIARITRKDGENLNDFEDRVYKTLEERVKTKIYVSQLTHIDHMLDLDD